MFFAQIQGILYNKQYKGNHKLCGMLKSKLPTKMVIQPPKSQKGSLSLKKYFLKDPNADLFINVASKIFPVHRSQLQSIPYFQHIAKNQKIHIIHESINKIEIFERILGYYYDENIVIESLQQLEQYLIIFQFLEITTLPDLIQKKLLTKPFNQEIEIFILLQIAYSYNLTEVLSFCFTMLEEEEFEQINYNKFDFMYIEFKLFQIVIRRHFRMKKVEHKIRGIDDEMIEETIRLYCKLHKIQEQVQEKLLKKYVSPKGIQNDLNHLLKGPTLSSQKDSSSINLVNHSPKRSEIDLYYEQNNDQIQHLKVPERQQKRRRKYSDGIEIFKVETSTDQGTKLCGSGRLKQKSKSPLLQQIKIKQETDEDNGFIEQIESPQIRINTIKQSTPRFDHSNKEKEPSDRIEPKSEKCINILKVPFLKNEDEKISGGLQADPDQLMDKVSELLDHYKSAFQLHESNMFTLKKRFADRSTIIDMDKDRRFSAGPADAPYRKQPLGGLSARLTNTVDIANKSNKRKPIDYKK